MLLTLKLDAFEGPLDLLLHLLDKNKLNIYDIPIAVITDQYLAYIKMLGSEKMDVMSEFIDMAATLIQIKSKMLLPKIVESEDEPDDPRQELVDKLLEYKKFKLIGSQLKGLQASAGKIVFKGASIPEEVLNFIPEADPEALLADIDFNRLYRVFRTVMRRQVDKVDKVRSGFGEIKREHFTIQDKVNELLTLRKIASRFMFTELLKEQRTKIEMIVIFLAILELMKSGMVQIIQETIYDDIAIEFI